MIPFRQKILNAENGDCLKTCIASILRCPPRVVPDFKGEDWVEQFEEWLWQKKKRLFIIKPESDVRFPAYATHAIGVGKSPRGEHKHAVVLEIKDQEYKGVHDPHPSDGGIDTLDYIIYFC